MPNGIVDIADSTSKVNLYDVRFSIENSKHDSDHWSMALERFTIMQQKKFPNKSSIKASGSTLLIFVTLETDDMSEKDFQSISGKT